VLLSLMAFAIDLAWLYVAHVEAQNVADASALAAARGIVGSGFTSVQGNDFLGIGRNLSTNLAQGEGRAVGGQYTVVGVTPTVTVNAPDYSTLNNPKVTASVSAAVPTFFIKAVSSSFTTVTVRASATAAAFNPASTASGSGTTGLSVVGTKPWMIPNIDPSHICFFGVSGNCTCTAAGGNAPFINRTNGKICNPGVTLFAFGGMVGAQFNLTPGVTTVAPAAGNYYQYSPAMLTAGAPTNIPSCGTGLNSYQQAIAGMFTTPVVTGTTYTLDPATSSVPLTQAAVQCLIHESAAGAGQDSMSFSFFGFSVLNLWPIGGASNPLPGAVGNGLSRSDSVVTMPVYDVGATPPTAPCPGGVCAPKTVIGFLQVFINGAPSGANPFRVTVQNVVGAISSTNPIITPAGSPVPVRLVQ
ncbi:MAG: pilus assembly protein TadG-related protein, partial [Candidatus Acidiferrales bacterium]